MESDATPPEVLFVLKTSFFAKKLDMNFDYLFRSSYMPV